MASFLIGGITLHTAFSLPLNQFGGQMPDLQADIANSIREKLINLKLLIIDEISMVGSTLFNRVDTRLRQIMGIDEPFGGISVLVVGDLNQLAPVKDTIIYKMNSTCDFTDLIGINPLWELFSLYELTEIMRRKDDLKFVEALNALAVGKMNDEHIQLFESRIVSSNKAPKDAIRLFTTNKSVDEFNEHKIQKEPGQEFISTAIDKVLGKSSITAKETFLDFLKTKKKADTNGLPYKLVLKKNIKYMITINIDVADGLVNGACGVLKDITLEKAKPEILWIDFHNENVGANAKIPYEKFISENNILKNLVPLKKHCSNLNISNKLQLPIDRIQFPIVPAEALTVHKSQGQTYKKVVIDFNEINTIRRKELYVALSRVPNLKSLFIIGKFRAPKPPKHDESLEELKRMKTFKALKLPLSFFKNSTGLKIAYQNICSLKKKLSL
jgi:hypothetical protein